MAEVEAGPTLLHGQDVGVGDADAAGGLLADDAKHLVGVGHPAQQCLQGWRVLVVARVEDHEAALDPAAVAPLLALQDPETKPLVIRPGPAEDRALFRPKLTDHSLPALACKHHLLLMGR